MLEEELKNKIWQRYFKKFDCTEIIKRIDFAVRINSKSAEHHATTDTDYLLWAEAKQQPTDIYRMLAQLIITIKQDAHEILPPKFIGCFDNEKIAFVPYHEILSIYNLNDFNWTQTPSSVDDKTVMTVRNNINKDKVFTFNYGIDDDSIKVFVEQNFTGGGSLLSSFIDRNNITFIYQKWHKMVRPFINVNWEALKTEYSIYDRDFFLAELNIDDNGTVDVSDDKAVNDEFYVTFDAKAKYPYQINRKTDLNFGANFMAFDFKKGGLEAYTDFWKRYKRPPQSDMWNFIVQRLDLLVPQDVRERKGAYFTPQCWVELSQKYIAEVLGTNWQDEYYVWDCCAGTGNLLNGLTNKLKTFASTLDQQDVDAMHERIRNGANLLKDHVFQFDFLNDDFSKCPDDLQKILNDPEKRRKLVIYINPPYAEASNARTVTNSGTNRPGVSLNKTKDKYKQKLGRAVNELFAQFFARIISELPTCKIGMFSTLKVLQGPNFEPFRQNFSAKLQSLFLVPAASFDNVKGSFPIGFQIYDTSIKEEFLEKTASFYNEEGIYGGEKIVYAYKSDKLIISWIRKYYDKENEHIAYHRYSGTDFQHSKDVYITLNPYKADIEQVKGTWITRNNIIPMVVYFTVRHIVPADWLNDRDQFLFPNDGWETDVEFQMNCLVYTLFHGQNRISANSQTNHWIPYSEEEVDAQGEFDSHFMSDFLSGKIKAEKQLDLFSAAYSSSETMYTSSLQFTNESRAVLDAGRELWRYYHQTAGNTSRLAENPYNANASLYDIKEYFQGRNESGKMNTTSADAEYMRLLADLKERLRALADCIRPKVYEYGFLK